MSASTSSPKKKAAPSKAAPARGGALVDHEMLCAAVSSFVRENCAFESSVVIKTAVEDLEAAGDLATVFELPLRGMLFPMDAALRWLLFLQLAPDRAVENGDKPFASGGHTPAKGLDLIAKTYDVGVEDAVWDHFDNDDDEDEEEDE